MDILFFLIIKRLPTNGNLNHFLFTASADLL